MLLALAVCASAALAATASAAASGDVTRIASPVANQVVGRAGVHVVLHSRASLRRLQILVNGHHVERYFTGSGGTYRATLRVGGGLQFGIDQLLVVTDAGADIDNVSFVVATNTPNLAGRSALQIGGRQAPVRIVTGLATTSTLQAWVNGHRADSAFQPTAAGYVGLLGANDWLRSGRNHVTLLAYRASPSGRFATYVVTSRSFSRKPGQLTAGAGPDQIGTAGQLIRLHGSATDPGSGNRGAPRVTYSWRIVGRPRGAVARLYGANSESPGLDTNAPGSYQVAVTVKGADGSSSTDTATVIDRADVPPIGVELQTADDYGTIKLNGVTVPDAADAQRCGTACTTTTSPCQKAPDGTVLCGYRYSYAIWNRQTLQLVASGYTAQMSTISDLATTYNKAPSYLMAVSFTAVGDDPNELAAGRQLLKTLGAPSMSDADADYMLRYAFPKSIVGVPGSPAGSAFLSVDRSQPYPGRHAVNMTGYLRLNPLSTTGNFEFVFPDQAEFDTDASPVRSRITMKFGSGSISHDVPVDGSSGFFLVRLNSRTLTLEKDFFYVTNKPDGTEVPGEAKRMADDIAWASAKDNSHGELLVMLEAFGKPKGTSAGWLQAAQAIGDLGGNPQVFAQMNQGLSDSPSQGRYAFVARSSMDVSAAESSQSLTGKDADGRLHGLLARGRDALYEPAAADPNGTVNFDLVSIVNRPTAPGGGFPAFTAGQAAAATFLARDPDIMGVCQPEPVPCDVRRTYYEKYTGVNWNTILSRLGNDATKAKCNAPPSGSGFTAAECQFARQELELEVGRRNTVEEYFGPKGLQAPFLGGVQVGALVDVSKIAEDIRNAVKPPAANNTVSKAMTILSLISRIGGFAGAVFPIAVPISAGISGAFALAGYLTNQNGSPDLIGPKVTTAAADLGVDLYTRYQRASAYFTTEAKIVMSDWTKMSQVAAAATSNPKWVLGDVATSVETMRLATKQMIYQSLFPVAYPVLYDLGTGVGHAKDWYCQGRGVTYDKHLFQNTDGGAELSWTLTSGKTIGARHVIALGARHTVGSLHSAYIPAPPSSITGPLFRDPAAPEGGGIGMYKLGFYSPQFFQVFPRVLQQGFRYCQDMPDPPGNSD